MHGLRKRQKKPGKREIRSISLKKQTEKNKKQKTGLTKEEKKRLKELRMIKAENQKKRKPFTAQDTIPYKEIYKDGICRTDDNYYSKMVQFYDINYQLAQNDDKAAIFENYCEFLNSFDSSVEVQITFLNQQVNFDEYAKNIDIPEQDDCFNDIRKEYSDMLKMQLSKGNNGLVKTKYITFSIKADNLRNAKSRLERIEASVLNNFKVMGAMAEPLNGVERLKILHDVMNMDTKESFHFHYGMVAKTGLQTKDFIAPTGFDFRNDSYFRMGQTFGCVSYLQITSPELTDKLLADLLDLEENLIINMHLRPIDPKAAIKSLKSTLSNIQKMKIEEQKKAVRSGYDMDIIPTDISTYGEDVEGLLNEIQSRNEKLFELTFLLMNTADNKRKLDNIVYQTAGIAQKYNCNIRRLQYQQEQGLVASLPLGMNQTGIQRIMTTTSTAIFVPFTTQELFQGGEALYYGLNALSNNLIMVDRKRLKTPNGLILGTPGSGKSFATKREILNVFLITDDDIIICDPEGEYFPLVNALNGEVIKISAKSNDYINPMEVNLDVIYHPEKYRINGDVEDIDTIIADKAEFITSFCEVIMKKPQNAELNGDEVSMIDLCVKDIYKKYLYNDPKPENMPTLQDFYERLNFYAPDKPAAQNIANSLQLYYTQLEASLQQKINQMEARYPGKDEYRYNIGEIGHDPHTLISYLTARYGDFKFDEIKGELETIFSLQYGITVEEKSETRQETSTIQVGQSLGNVVTSGYCNCPICCGVWSGGPTASGAMPQANHTLAVDAANPFLPMGTKVVMNGIEYTVEDTGNFAQYGVQFDVYYDNHAVAEAHGHQTWECFLAEGNQNSVEVTRTVTADVLNVSVQAKPLRSVILSRMEEDEQEIYEEVYSNRGNLQTYKTPVELNWYAYISTYYGYSVNNGTGQTQLHRGVTINVRQGTEVKSAMNGFVVDVGYSGTFGNYVVTQDKKGVQIKYAYLQSISVANGQEVTTDTVIGTTGSTGSATGSQLYLELVKDGEYYNPVFYISTGDSGLYGGGGSYDDETVRRLFAEADKYLGMPYVWGGSSPETSFDCSGFVSYVFTNSGVCNMGRLTAQGIYDICMPVSPEEARPGDIIFFTGTYDAGEPVTHVGIYAGDGQMIHCGNPIQYTSINSAYWQSHFYAFGRP